MKRNILYGVGIVVALVLLFNSVYIKSLDEIAKEQKKNRVFEPSVFAAEFFDKTLLTMNDDAVDYLNLIAEINKDATSACSQFGNRLGVSSVCNYLVKGSGKIVDRNDEGFIVDVKNIGTNKDILIATEFIFGNTLRDASGKIAVENYPNSREFNAIAVALNNIVTGTIVPGFIDSIQIGDNITFYGAAEINCDTPDIQLLSVVPISVTSNGGKK